MQSEVEELKKKIEEFEERYSEVEKENQARLKEAEEAQLKATQLQEAIERLSSNNWPQKASPPSWIGIDCVFFMTPD